MAQLNKIEKYNLAERVLALAAEGKTTAQIADILTAELTGTDSISQPAVSRWLKSVREERSNQTKQIVHDHIKATVPKDLEALDEVEEFMLSVFRNTKKNPETGKNESAGYELRTRADAGMKAVKIIETKLRFAGVLDDPERSGARVDPVDLEQFKNDLQELKEGRNG